MTAFSPDALIFDVDGVLLDVRKSFPEMIRRTITTLWEKRGGEADSEGYNSEYEWVLKRHGFFNDDYIIPWVLLCMALASGEKKLSLALPSPARLADMIKNSGSDVEEWTRRNFGDEIKLLTVQEEGWGLYAGDGRNPGLYNLEVPLVSTNWKDMPLPVGIYTGRNTAEWALAKATLGWQDFPLSQTILYDTGVRKPSPLGIEILSDRMGFKRPMFFGDTASDAKALRAYDSNGLFTAIGNLLPEEKSYPSAQAALNDIFGI